MTPPDVNLKKQSKRHKGPLIGIIIAVSVAFIALLWMLSSNVTADPETADNPPAAIEGSVGLPAEGSVAGPSSTGAPQVIETSPSSVD